MNTHGIYIIELEDGIDNYHPTGGWTIKRDNAIIAQTVIHNEWPGAVVAPRLGGVQPGDQIEAASYTGRTGLSGTVLARAGKFLKVTGNAWGAMQNRANWHTHTFNVIDVEVYYSGSLKALSGMRTGDGFANRMLQAIADIVTPADNTNEYATRAPMWAAA